MSLWPGKTPIPSLHLGSYANTPFRRFSLGSSETASHKHVIGVTGQGKSRLLQALFVQLLSQRVGVSLLDPHKDLARDILAYLLEHGFFDRPEAYKRLVYIDFSLPRYVPFNVLTARREPHDVAYAFLEAVKRAWPALADGQAPMLENIMLPATVTLIENNLPDITTSDIGQAHNQEARARAEYEAHGYTIRGTVVTHLTGIAADAESSAGDLKILPKATVLALWDKLKLHLSVYRQHWSMDDVSVRKAAAAELRPKLPAPGWLTRVLDTPDRCITPGVMLAEWP